MGQKIIFGAIFQETWKMKKILKFQKNLKFNGKFLVKKIGPNDSPIPLSLKAKPITLWFTILSFFKQNLSKNCGKCEQNNGTLGKVHKI